MAASLSGDGRASGDSPSDDARVLQPCPGLLSLPGEVLELILCSGGLDYRDIVSAARSCRRLRDMCVARGTVWRRQLFARWPSIMKHYNHLDLLDWLGEFKTRHKAGIEAQRIVAAFSKALIIEHRMPCEGFNDLDTSAYPIHFIEDELLSILKTENGKCLTKKYCAKKILYFMQQDATICKLKGYLQRPVDQQDILEGAVLIDQYCNPLEDVSLENIQAEIKNITRKVKVYLSTKNSRHPSLSLQAGESSYIEDLDLQGQALDALNHVLFTEMKFKGNVADFYNPLNSYIHQVLIKRTGIPISLSVLYLTLAEHLGVHLEPINFPNHFMLRWCQSAQGGSNITDYMYVDAFGYGKCLTAKECEYMIGQHVTEEFYAAVRTKEVLQRMVGNLLNMGKRESKDGSFMLLRVSLDLYLTMYPDSVQHLLLQARLYFHLGIWPEKVLDILQNIQALDPSQHGAVAYLVQHTLEHIERRKEDFGPNVRRRSSEKEVCYSVGLLVRHKRYDYRGVIFGWDPVCMMPPDWIEILSVHQLPQGASQPFYNVLLDDGSYSYVAQENLEPHPEPGPVQHPDIAHYFSEFAETHYIANKELQLQYPEDTDFNIQLSLLRQSDAPQLEP
ncbi:LOW QUALITY PROTEIN: F-box only protein 21 [Bufo gargarizans]|uniref:LOW QUALITY PROTEIN: F-box only protein 21 n=1 Tax=Bufo gargarizans TaxID=30331 RepID=UPI001CF490F0|nr:LOW QUALITY PROTEIN: F-box only protein 21 [Bufo gargarizans]